MKKSHAIVTLAIGDEGNKLLNVSRPSMEAYAERIGADFKVIDQRRFTDPRMVYFEKLQVGELLSDYERLLYLDTDVIIHPHSPDIFAVAPPECFTAWDLGPYYEPGEIESVHQLFGEMPDWDANQYYCSGIFVVGREQKSLFTLSQEFLGGEHLSNGLWNDQAYLNRYLRRLRLPHRRLDDLWHWCSTHSYVPANAHFVHFLGLGFYRPLDAPEPDRVVNRQRQMEAYAEHLRCSPSEPWFAPRSFPKDDPFWRATADHLRACVGVDAPILAPGEFNPLFSQAFPYDAQRHHDLAMFEAMVLHKGMLAPLDARLLNWMMKNLTPSFANEVFVVYARGPVTAAIDPRHLQAVLDEWRRKSDPRLWKDAVTTPLRV